MIGSKREFPNGRWPEGEQVILEAENPYWMSHYTDAIGGRWPEAEEFLIDSGSAKDIISYLNRIRGHGKRWPEGEQISLERAFTELDDGAISSLVTAARYVRNGQRWPELEDKLINLGNPSHLESYWVNLRMGDRGLFFEDRGEEIKAVILKSLEGFRWGRYGFYEDDRYLWFVTNLASSSGKPWPEGEKFFSRSPNSVARSEYIRRWPGRKEFLK